ncbi:MAG: hypothetical protein ACD_22C00030G0002 [uncultured bacterium]|nr:MAG: hypothetical protein ACD_22C00030G0002 [uncultured bacterium]
MSNPPATPTNNKTKYLSELKELLRIPSISTQPEHKKDILMAAEWLKNHLAKIGLNNCKVMKTAGHPIVYADYLLAKDKPTVLIYGHYDVQPPEPLESWNTPPFEPTEKNGNLYGRGTSDDKAQIFAHIKAIDAIMSATEKLPVNVKFLIEGEEEVGGPSLDKFIIDNKKMLSADVCVISDSHSLSPTQPLIEYGLRGMAYMQIDLSTFENDVHSGLYGGNVPNVAIELANIISKLKDEKTQKILIPGFYDNVRKLTAKEKQALNKTPLTKKAIMEETGAKTTIGLVGASIPERCGALPALDVNGFFSGYTGEGSKTIIPAKASAKISMRLVPNQSSAEIAKKFATYIKRVTPKYVGVTVKTLNTGEPILMDTSSIYFKKAEEVFIKTFGNKPIYVLDGASIPVTSVIKRVLNIDSILMGFGLPDDGLHSPNEKISLEMFYKGIETSISYLSAL